MAKKPTKRKAFNFLRSYFDVLNELENDQDRLNFLMSIINKQFLDEDPKGLNFIVNLCYESQRHSVEKSVKGWITANKTDLLGNHIPDPTPPPKGDPEPDPTPPPKEDEEQEEVKDKEKIDYALLIDFFNKTYGRNTRTISAKAKKQIRDRLKEGYTKKDLQRALENAKNDSYHIETNFKYITLEFISRADKFERFSQNHQTSVKPKMI